MKPKLLPSYKIIIVQGWNRIGWHPKKVSFCSRAAISASRSLRAQGWRTVSSSCPLEKNSCLFCSRAPHVLNVCKNDKRGIIFFQTRRIPVCYARARLSFSPRASMTNGVVFSSSREELPFIMLACASCSLSMRARRTGSFSHPTEKNSRSLWSPNFAPVTKIQSCGCEIILSGARSYRACLQCSHPRDTSMSRFLSHLVQVNIILL